MAEDMMTALTLLGFFSLVLGTGWANDRRHHPQDRSTPDL